MTIFGKDMQPVAALFLGRIAGHIGLPQQYLSLWRTDGIGYELNADAGEETFILPDEPELFNGLPDAVGYCHLKIE